MLTSLLIQGTTIPLVARLLRVDELPQLATPTPEPDIVWEPPSVSAPASKQQEIRLPANSPVAGKQIVEVGFPSNALVIALQRDDRTLVPTGSTTLLPGDRLIMVIEDEAVNAVRSLLHAEDGVAPDNDGSPSG